MATSLNRRALLAGAALLLASPSSVLFAAPPEPVRAERVDVFAAQKAGQIELKFIPKNAAEGKLLVKNLTKKPLDVELPMGFAGVPVLAQFQPGGQAQGQAQGQAVGVGIGNGNRNGNGNPFGNGNGGGNGFGFMNIPAEKVGELPLELVCLEHGKPDPRPAMAYEIKPIAEYTARTEVQEFVRQFARGKFTHAAAQAAAWNLANGMSWDELAALRVKRYATVVTPEAPRVFEAQSLEEARRIVAAVEQAVKASEESLSQR